MSHYFYLARCADDSLYAGTTIDITSREKAHNEGRGAKYTRAHLPVQIVYTEEFDTKSEALQREAEVKKWRKKKKEALLSLPSSLLPLYGTFSE